MLLKQNFVPLHFDGPAPLFQRECFRTMKCKQY